MEHPKVLVMATPMTIHEEKFHVLMERYKEKAQILPLPCPGLMDFIERGDLDGEDLHKYLEDLLYSYRETRWMQRYSAAHIIRLPENRFSRCWGRM